MNCLRNRARRPRVWIASALLLSACGGLRATPYAEERRATLPPILVLMPDSRSAHDALRGLREELSNEFELVVSYVKADTRPSVVAREMDRVQPRAVVLMNNPTVRIYRRFQVRTPGAARTPVVVLLTSFLRPSTRGLENYTGVIYEVPLVTSLVNLRDLLDQPIQRVGVVHRRGFSNFLAEQQTLARAEGFSLVRTEIGPDDQEALREAVTRLRRSDRVDAIWVLNDNALLDGGDIRNGWLPALADNETPVLVNVGTLISPGASFGTFAVLPDHRALGRQAASLVATLAENGWRASGLKIEYPLTVEKVLDLNFARRKLRLREQRLATVDRLLE